MALFPLHPIRATVLPGAIDGRLQLAHLLGFGLAFMLYGAYLSTFLMSLVLAYRHQRVFTWYIKVLYLTNFVLFLIATVFTAINFLRLVRAFAFNTSDSLGYLSDPSHLHWERFALGMLMFLALNIGDTFVIHRCYIIWSGNIYVVLFPIFLATLSFGGGCVFFAFYGRQSLALPAISARLLPAIYLLHLIQNLLTTGLIVVRIWKHHQNSSRAGVRSMGVHVSLASVARIIAESAMIYTLQLLLLIILWVMRSNYAITVTYTVVPTAGLVFNVIAARIYIAQAKALARGQSTSLLQTLSVA